MSELNNKAQVTIFIIVALIIVAGIALFFVLRNGEPSSNIQSEFTPVYDYYISCLEENSYQGISLLGEQAGYIYLPEFEPGSAYAPFSSQLNFFGQGVPYWMYVSGNNLLKEQVPSKSSMQEQLGDYVNERVSYCDFTTFENEGFDIFIDPDSNVDASINDLNIDIDVKNKLTIFRGNESVVFENHRISLSSKLGKFYGLAREVYDFEKSSSFLEEYSIDVMRLYAPVDGSEISCKPLIFNKQEIKENIVEGLNANIGFLKLKGDYYNLENENSEYFVNELDFLIDENVNFMYLPNWPTKIEIYGDTIAEPIGLQEGLSVMGFCYVPYHFVYDISYPVMVQFYDEENLFQFPVGVVIQKSQSREALPTSTGTLVEEQICQYKNQEISVSTFDVDSNPVEAILSFECLDSICQIGETKINGGEATSKFYVPQCVNGFIKAKAEGYADSRYQISTNEITNADIFLNKKYNLSLDLGDVNATISFVSEDFSAMAIYPEISSVELIEGYYNITVYVYDDSSLVFPALNERKCVDVPESGLAGIFGVQAEKCFDINIPQTQIDFAVVGGGKSQEYIDVTSLKNSNEINMAVPLFDLPRDLDELQENHIRVENERLVISFE